AMQPDSRFGPLARTGMPRREISSPSPSSSRLQTGMPSLDSVPGQPSSTQSNRRQIQPPPNQRKCACRTLPRQALIFTLMNNEANTIMIYNDFKPELRSLIHSLTERGFSIIGGNN